MRRFYLRKPRAHILINGIIGNWPVGKAFDHRKLEAAY
jgi:hypothetical protein